MELYQQCDVLVVTGDLELSDFSGLAYHLYQNQQDSSQIKPAFGVYGNHDTPDYLEELKIINLHNTVYDFNGLRWGGFQGCIKYKESDVMYTDEQAKEFAETFPYVDVLLLHAGPKDMLDDSSDYIHEGNEHIKRYVLEKKPKFVFVGHQYSDDYLDLGNTKIYRTYGARILELEIT